MKSKNIVVIDNYDSFVFNLIRYVEELIGNQVVVMRNDQVDEKLLELSDTIILSPGPGIPEEAGVLMEIIARFHSTKKIIGICLGHQAIGQFFGHQLEQCNAPIHGKSSMIRIDHSSAVFQGLPEEIQVGRYHSWKIAPNDQSDLEIIGRSESDEIMAIQHRRLPIFGLQFHPESILTPTGRKQVLNLLNY